MEDTLESLKTRITELEAKLSDRTDRLKRAWDALETVRTTLRRRTSPGAFHLETKSFKTFGRLLADGIEEEFDKRDKKYVNLSSAARRTYTWVGRAPKNEKETEEMKAIKKTFDLAICGITEGVPYESFYDTHPQMHPKPEATEVSPECDSPTTQTPAPSRPPESDS